MPNKTVKLLLRNGKCFVVDENNCRLRFYLYFFIFLYYVSPSTATAHKYFWVESLQHDLNILPYLWWKKLNVSAVLKNQFLQDFWFYSTCRTRNMYFPLCTTVKQKSRGLTAKGLSGLLLLCLYKILVM